MLRAVGLAVSLVVGIAAPAAANHSGHGAKGLAAAAQQGAAGRGDAALVAERTTPVQVTDGCERRTFVSARIPGGPAA